MKNNKITTIIILTVIIIFLYCKYSEIMQIQTTINILMPEAYNLIKESLKNDEIIKRYFSITIEINNKPINFFSIDRCFCGTDASIYHYFSQYDWIKHIQNKSPTIKIATDYFQHSVTIISAENINESKQYIIDQLVIETEKFDTRSKESKIEFVTEFVNKLDYASYVRTEDYYIGNLKMLKIFYIEYYRSLCLESSSMIGEGLNIIMWSIVPKLVTSLITKKIYQYGPVVLYKMLDKRFLRILEPLIRMYYEK